jgi:ferredoxin
MPTPLCLRSCIVLPAWLLLTPLPACRLNACMHCGLLVVACPVLLIILLGVLG